MISARSTRTIFNLGKYEGGAIDLSETCWQKLVQYGPFVSHMILATCTYDPGELHGLLYLRRAACIAVHFPLFARAEVVQMCA